jgi:hypothetical protein
LAQWCGLDWRPQYFSLTAAARKAGFKDKQVAFVGFLHGSIQGFVIEAQKSDKCTDSERNEVKKMMQRLPTTPFSRPT